MPGFASRRRAWSSFALPVLLATGSGVEKACCQSCCTDDALASGGTPGPSQLEQPERQLTGLYYDRDFQHVWRTNGEQLEYLEAEYHFGLVADLDLNSRDPQEFIWRLGRAAW
ncbi:unnamed protein product [Effrenium voratum]|nr:unnamed protein product [Effrenium voratum]